MEVKNLKAYLANVNITFSEFCEMIGYDLGYMSRVIHNKCKPSERLAKEVSKATSGVIRLDYTPRKKKYNHQYKHKNTQTE